MYEAHFGFRFPPFGLTPDTRFYFSEASHQEALNTLLVALRSGEGFLKITGEIGLGKTLLCRQLLNALGPEFVTAYVPNPAVTPRALFQTVADELGCPNEGHRPDELLKAIGARLMDNAARGLRTVLIVDEAQALTNHTLEAIRLLTNLETETYKLLQVVLFGQPELDERLAMPDLRQLRQRITFSYRLQPLSREQFGAYVRHRLEVAGAASAPGLFTEPALRVLFRASRGIPRLANILCHKALLAAFGPGRAGVGRRDAFDAVYDTEGTEIPALSKVLLFTQENLGLVCLALVVSIAIAYMLSFGLASWLGAAL